MYICRRWFGAGVSVWDDSKVEISQSERRVVPDSDERRSKWRWRRKKVERREKEMNQLCRKTGGITVDWENEAELSVKIYIVRWHVVQMCSLVTAVGVARWCMAIVNALGLWNNRLLGRLMAISLLCSDHGQDVSQSPGSIIWYRQSRVILCS